MLSTPTKYVANMSLSRNYCSKVPAGTKMLCSFSVTRILGDGWMDSGGGGGVGGGGFAQ